MGTKLAPSYANIFMGEFEHLHVYPYHLQPSLWKRFIDDIFFIWPHGTEELKRFVEFLNNRHQTIKFTLEHSYFNVNFLDVTVLLNKDNTITTTLYCKPTDSHNYLLYSSEHPRHVLNGTFSQFLRVRRICSNHSDFVANSLMLASHFVRRGYPRPLIKKGLYRADKQDRDSLLEGRHGDILNSPTGSTHDSNIETSPADTFYCITTHNPRNPPLWGIITNNWEVLLKSKTTRILENAKIVFGSRRNKNLSDFLVRASTRTEPEPLRNIDKSPCNRPNSFMYCPKLNASGTLISKSSGRSYGCRTNVN